LLAADQCCVGFIPLTNVSGDKDSVFAIDVQGDGHSTIIILLFLHVWLLDKLYSNTLLQIIDSIVVFLLRKADDVDSYSYSFCKQGESNKLFPEIFRKFFSK